MIIERFSNGKTYCIRDIGSDNTRQVTREQFKVAEVPLGTSKERRRVGETLPRIKKN